MQRPIRPNWSFICHPQCTQHISLSRHTSFPFSIAIQRWITTVSTYQTELCFYNLLLTCILFLGNYLTSIGEQPGLQRQRHFFDDRQLILLDSEFDCNPFPTRQRRQWIATQLNVSDKSVLVNEIIPIYIFLPSLNSIFHFSGGFKTDVVEYVTNRRSNNVLEILQL